MNLRKWAMFLLPAACLGLAGCGMPGASSNRVVYANFDDADGFCSQIRAAFDQKAKADGIEVTYLDAKGSGNMQIDQMNDAISSGAGAIVLLAADGTSIVKSIE
ncbi:MAG: sugar ABC transporter substrate-binding protein, partial [Selenomonas artemidis]